MYAVGNREDNPRDRSLPRTGGQGRCKGKVRKVYHERGMPSSVKIKTLSSGSHGNCYLVDDGKTQLLLEAGIPWKKIKEALNFQTSGISGILITHEHIDHAKAMKHALDEGVDIYTSKGTVEAMGEKKGYNGVQNHYRMNIVKSQIQFRVGTWTILPFDTPHDVREMLCYLLQSDNGEKLLFITDSGYTEYRFEGLTHIMIEANHCADILAEKNVSAGARKKLGQRVRRNHMSLETLIKMLKANDLSQCREIHLLHLSDANSDEARMIREVQEATGIPCYACDG